MVLGGGVVLVLALLGGEPQATSTTTTTSWRAPAAAKLDEVVRSGRKRPVADRLTFVTEPLLGAPYQLNPLGEGEGVDPDPRLRTDAFDCTTFVETGIALTLAERGDELQDVLDLIRYRAGRPGYQNRRHFPEAEWIPDLIALGVLEDATRIVAGSEVVVAKKKIDRTTWSGPRKKNLKDLDESRLPIGEFALDVWPIEKAKRGYRRIPPGTVLSVVRADRKDVPVRVSHQGLVVEKGGKLYLRHAANKIYHRVVDEPLESFLTRNAKYRKWPVTGVHLARVSEPDTSWKARAVAVRE